MSTSNNQVAPPTIRKKRPSTLETPGGKLTNSHISSKIDMKGYHNHLGRGTSKMMKNRELLNNNNQDKGFPLAKAWDSQDGDQLMASVYSFLKIYLSSAEMSNESIDVRIEQAMDLVKSLLKNTVKSEFCKYHSQIVHLEEVAAQLQSENEALRQHVGSDILSQLDQKFSELTPESSPDQDLLEHLEKED